MNDLKPSLWSRSDGIAALGILVVAFTVGQLAVNAFMRAGNLPQYYQGEFGPAVLLACGHGFVNPPKPEPPSSGPAPGFEALSAFLGQRRDSLDCREVPDSFTGVPPNVWQGNYRYLLMSAAGVWRLTGVSWPALSVLSATFAAVTAALVYLLARTSMGRVLSLAITALMIGSPLQLTQLPHLRDYGKAPFFMFTLCAVAWIALTRASRGRTTVALAITGAVLGLGFGFRTDVASYLLFVLVAVLAFRPGFDRTDLITRGLAAASAVIAFVVVASPILKAYQSADTIAHWAVLGLSDPSRDWLGLRETPYSYGYFYDDSYVARVIAGYSDRLGPQTGPVLLFSPEYSKWSAEYYRSLIMTFPGDVLLRAWAAVAAIFQLPFREASVIRPQWIGPSWDLPFHYRATLLSWLAFFPPAVAATALALGASVVSARLLGLLLLFGIIVPGMTSIQFQDRHAFHLEILPLFVYGCVLHFVWRVLRHRARLMLPLTRASGVRAMLVAVGLAFLVVVPVIAARAYQQRTVTKLFSAYESAELGPIEVAEVPQPDGQLLLSTPLGVSREPPHYIDTNVLSVAVGGEECDADAVLLKLRYSGIAPFSDFSHPAIVPLTVGHVTRLVLPIYTLGARSTATESERFVGVELAATDAPCIQSLARFKHPERFPLLLESLLLPDWRQRPLYEGLRELEPHSDDWLIDNYTVPAGLRLGRRRLSQLAVENSHTTYQSPQVRRIDNHLIEIRGDADTSTAYLLTWPYEIRQKGSVFFVEGELFEGGLTVGIQQKEQWVANLNVLQPGRFRAALQVENPGDYSAVLANIMLRGLYARMTISRYGWLPPAPSSP